MTVTLAVPGLRPLVLPPVQESTLRNGLSVLASSRGPLPLVSLELVVRGAGSAADPSGKFGLANLTAKLLRRGTQRLSADEIDQAIEFVGGTLHVGVEEDALSISISAPSQHVGAMLDVLGQLAAAPSFPQGEVDSARQRILAQIANELDDPKAVADRGLLRAVYGSHAYGHDVLGRLAHVRTLSRDDVAAFYRAHFGPSVSTLIIVGDVRPEDVRAMAERSFAGYSGSPVAAAALPALARPAMAGKVLIIDKPDQTQTQIRIGAVGIARAHRDFFPIKAFNTVLGGSFTSRLMQEVRVKRGLSYGASSEFHKRRAAGHFEVSTFTKSESTAEVLEVALGELVRMRAKGPTAAELGKTQRYIAGAFPAHVETNDGLVALLSDAVVFSLPLDWMRRYRENIMAVDGAAASRAARTYLRDEPAAIVLVGNAAAIVEQAKRFGPVEVLKVADVE